MTHLSYKFPISVEYILFPRKCVTCVTRVIKMGEKSLLIYVGFGSRLEFGARGGLTLILKTLFFPHLKQVAFNRTPTGSRE